MGQVCFTSAVLKPQGEMREFWCFSSDSSRTQLLRGFRKIFDVWWRHLAKMQASRNNAQKTEPVCLITKLKTSFKVGASAIIFLLAYFLFSVACSSDITLLFLVYCPKVVKQTDPRFYTTTCIIFSQRSVDVQLH